MRPTRTLVFFLFCTAAATVSAGDLNPPVGPVAPTQRIPVNANATPGDADSVFKITTPGSYYLTANITGVDGKHGIEIASGGVTLDLNGFELQGVPFLGFDGIRNTLVGATNIAIFNGTIRGWGGDGIDLITTAVHNFRIEDIRASNNSAVGINAGVGGTITNCVSFSNTSNGFASGGNSVFSKCVANDNNGNGFSAGSGSTVVHCASYFNSGVGIIVSIGGQVTECTAQSNSSDGILCGDNSVIRNNTCTLNGNGAPSGAGIRTIATGCRIEGNTCADADTGIDVDAAGNIIIRNTCSGNTNNWTIVANNVVGPIIDRTAPASAAISGNSAPSSLGSTDPNANFSY